MEHQEELVKRAGLVLISLAAVACSTVIGPGMQTHPAGEVFATTPLAGEPYGVAISPSGDVLIAQVLGGVISHCHLPDTRLVSRLESGYQPVHIAFDVAGARAYLVNQGGQYLRVVQLAPFVIIDSLRLTNDGFNVAVHPKGGRAYVTTGDGRVYVVATATIRVVDSMRVGSSANGLAFSPDGRRLYISSRDAGTITSFDTETDNPIDTLVTTGAPQRIVISRDGTTLFVANERHGIDVVSVSTGLLEPGIPLDGAAYGLALTPDGKQLYATNPRTGNVFIIDVASSQILKTLSVGGAPRNVAFNYDGRIAIVTDGDGRVIFIQ